MEKIKAKTTVSKYAKRFAAANLMKEKTDH